VRINDRGPFLSNRLIDLSYTAAYKLDVLDSGSAWVEVEIRRLQMPHNLRSFESSLDDSTGNGIL